MFPRASSLPALKSVRLPQPAARSSSADGLDGRSPFMSSGAAAALRAARDSSSSAGTGGSSSSAGGAGGPPFGPGSLDNLAACCPHLAQLWLTAAVSTGVDLAPLRQLTALTELQLGGAVVDDAASKQVLCGLSQLQRLDLVQCPRFTDAGLAYLTALTELTSLQVRMVGPGQGVVLTWCGSLVAVGCAGYRAVCVLLQHLQTCCYYCCTFGLSEHARGVCDERVRLLPAGQGLWPEPLHGWAGAGVVHVQEAGGACVCACVRALPDCAACLHVHAALVSALSCFAVCRSLLRQWEGQKCVKVTTPWSLVCPVVACMHSSAVVACLRHHVRQ